MRRRAGPQCDRVEHGSVGAGPPQANAAYFSTCPRGLEALLAEDIAACGGTAITTTPGGAGFSGSLETCYRLNLHSRIATRVLCRLASAEYRDERDIYRLAFEIAWPRLFEVSRSIRVYVTATKAPVKSLEYLTLKVKDAVCDRFRADCGRRPDVNTAAPDVRIHLYVTATEATLYLDTSGEPLWLRGQKIAKVAAPLKENLAAGILRLSGWRPGVPLIDPMCGSGTLLLEAAGMALDDAPGLSREMKDFGFTKWLDYRPALWKRLCVEAAERRVAAPGKLPIWGADLNADAVARTRQNLAHAGLDHLIEVRKIDILDITPPAPGGVLVANPPYGERLGELDALAAFYPRLGDALKKRFAGWSCWFLSADARLPKLIGLKPKRKIPLWNGPLECRLYGFDIVAGSARK
ncbi:THUMP domain-containing class I SAM-dependent RNA methyltransferase [Sulfuricystis multivorans]|uniref:THUMP domain-containing class I SAM-dependent RNA methyltransferase n=1 Tax=Sulfuricystis multivorans TaxID=2211108 RepID=UPI000F8273C0|nr:THUMP domain-containing protein [Sulfuricystis multivorans]